MGVWDTVDHASLDAAQQKALSDLWASNPNLKAGIENLIANNDLNTAVNDQFLLLMGLLVFLMQAGFGLLEAGSVRAKNVTNILFKNYLDVAVASLSYWAIGWAISNGAEGSSPFITTGDFFLKDEMNDASISGFFFQFAFAATAATIVSGAVAERVKFEAYLIYSAVITALIYPIGAYWGWHGEGWLKKGFSTDYGQVTYTDYAGSGIVHMVGGTAALAGAVFTGPRLARRDGPIPGHSIAMQTLGGFILMFGFFAFNGGSELAISSSPSSQNVGQAFISTLLCGSGGMLSAVVGERIFGKVWNLSTAINGSLTGMVAACAGCDGLRPYAAVLVGLVAGVIYLLAEKLMTKLKVDDPLNAVAVHLGGGLWGVMTVPLLHENYGVFYKSFDNHSVSLLGWNAVGALAYFSWAAVTSSGMFLLLKFVGLLRVDEETERRGLDVSKHGGHGYYMVMDDDDARPQSGKVHPNV